MSVSTSLAETRILISNVAWSAYDALVKGVDSAGTRFTYDRGFLEIMSPSREHERIKRLLGRMVEMLTLERKIPIGSGGSTTLNSELQQRGLEPDECYFIAHEPQMRGRDDYDPAVDPPPDLAIEVDLSRSSIDKRPLYADLGVPEIWTFEEDRLEFYRLLPSGLYQPFERSLAFPFLASADLQRFLDERHGAEETDWTRRFCDWVREIPG